MPLTTQSHWLCKLFHCGNKLTNLMLQSACCCRNNSYASSAFLVQVCGVLVNWSTARVCKCEVFKLYKHSSQCMRCFYALVGEIECMFVCELVLCVRKRTCQHNWICPGVSVWVSRMVCLCVCVWMWVDVCAWNSRTLFMRFTPSFPSFAAGGPH